MTDKSGYVRGKHFTEYVDKVKRLRRDGKTAEAVALLLELIAANENEATVGDVLFPICPWYYEQLAITYRKIGSLNDEIALLERFAKQNHGKQGPDPNLLSRLEKVRAKVQRMRAAGDANSGLPPS